MFELNKLNGLPFEELPEDLRTLAERALSNARREMEQTGKLNPAVQLQDEKGNVELLHLTDQQSSVFFETGSHRAGFWFALRQTVKIGHVAAVIIAHDGWTARATKAYGEMPPAEQHKLVRDARSIESLVERGLATRHEAILVTVQTPAKVAIVEQVYRRERTARRIHWDERTARLFPQRTFHGPMKMYGRDGDA